jgi:WD40 repeat protein
MLSCCVLFCCMRIQMSPSQKHLEYPFSLLGNTRTIHGAYLSGDGNILCVGGMGDGIDDPGMWVLWDTRNRKQISKGVLEKGGVHSIALSPNNRLLAAGGNGAELKVFETATGKMVAELRGHRSVIRRVLFTPDGKRLLSAGYDNMLRVWEVDEWKQHACFRFTGSNPDWNLWNAFPDKTHEIPKVKITFSETVERLNEFSVSTDSKSIFVTTGIQDVWVLDLLTGKRKDTLVTQLESGAFSVAISPDGKLLAIGGGTALQRGVIEIWDVVNCRRKAILAGHKKTVLSLGFSADSKMLVSGGFDGAMVWEVFSGRVSRSFYGIGEVRFVSFFPDSQMIITAGEKRGRIWNVDTGKEVFVFRK